MWVVIGVHNFYIKEKNVNSGVLFTDSILQWIYNSVEEMENPMFYVSFAEEKSIRLIKNQDLVD